MTGHPNWWEEVCRQHDQDPDDPDAFCTTPPAELERMLKQAEAAYYMRLLDGAEFKL